MVTEKTSLDASKIGEFPLKCHSGTSETSLKKSVTSVDAPLGAFLGLSNGSNLTATFNLKIYLNGEYKAVSAEKFTPKNPQKKRYVRNGKICQSGLTSHAKKTIRLVACGFKKLCEDEKFRNDNILIKDFDSKVYSSYTRFITLSFRNIIPSDSEAKVLLDTFLKRFRRKVDANFSGHKLRYIWVQELQKRGAIHFHLLTPDKIYLDKDTDNSFKIRHEEHIWLNRTWNEIVSGWAYKSGRITIKERDKWLDELRRNEKYNNLLYLHKSGLRNQPRKPSKSKFLLLPNVIHVNDATRYMTKYMGKEGHKIGGNMWGCDMDSRSFTKPVSVTKIPVTGSIYANSIIKYIARNSKGFKYMNSVKYVSGLALWGTNGWSALEEYFNYLDLYGLYPTLEKMKTIGGLPPPI